MHFLEFRFLPATQPLTDNWRHQPVVTRGSTRLGISFRLLQAAAFGLDGRAALQELLAYPFQVVRLGAYWNQIETEPGEFNVKELDWQIEAAVRANKSIILCIGPMKTFGYPEFFVPHHRLPQPFKEHELVTPEDYPALLEAAIQHINRLVDRYRDCRSLVAWQLEHEAVDPLGIEHSWRLSAAFVEREAAALRAVDPSRPLMMNGFLPTSIPVQLSQWWRTRDQGDSLAVASSLADLVGIDDYPRNALFAVGNRTLYLDGSQSGWVQKRRRRWLEWAYANGKHLLIAEGQAEPWETVTIPPHPDRQGMSSCLPEHVISNYNAWLSASQPPEALYAYLFWGAEYWLTRKQEGDLSYIQAFIRILESS